MTCLKILGSVGRKIFFFFFFFFKVMTKLFFSNQFCFFYILIAVKTVQKGNRCGSWGILCSTDGKTANLSQRLLSFYGILSSKAIKTLGSQQKIRVGRVTGNKPNLIITRDQYCKDYLPTTFNASEANRSSNLFVSLLHNARVYGQVDIHTNRPTYQSTDKNVQSIMPSFFERG